jgi:phage gpG-like protein
VSDSSVNFRVDGEASRRLGVIAERGADLAPVMRQIGNELLQLRSQRFRRGRGVNGVPWKPKQRVINGKKLPLIFSGRLADSIAVQADANSVTLGSILPYARIHEFGGSITLHPFSRKVLFREVGKAGSGQFRFAGRKSKSKRLVSKPVEYGARTINIPARPWLRIDAQDRAAISTVIGEHFERLLKGGAA